jgi:DNA polymerase-3 subunit delta
VADSSRFNVFDLADSALSGDSRRCLRIINGLDAEGTAAPLVLWALSRDLRMLAELSNQIRQGRSPQQAVAARHDIWQQRKQLVTSALQRQANWRRLLLLCGQADRAIKGRSYHNPWLLFKEIATGMCGVHPLPQPKVSHYG